MDGEMFQKKRENGEHGVNLQQCPFVHVHVGQELHDLGKSEDNQRLQQHVKESVPQEEQLSGDTAHAVLPSPQQQQQSYLQQGQQQQTQQSVSVPLRQPQQQQQGESAAQRHEEVVSPQKSPLLSNDASEPEGTTLWKQCPSCNMPIPLYMLQRHLADCQTQVDPKEVDADLPSRSNKQGVFVCGVCSKLFPDQDSILQHEQSHRDQKAQRPGALNGQSGSIFMCSFCCLRFQSAEELIKHVEVHQSGNQEDGSCRVCREVFHNPVNLLQHVEAHHRHLKACPCGVVFPSKQEFREHQDLCQPVLRDPTSATTSAKSYKCRLCSRIFGRVQSRLQHERVHRRSHGNGQLAFEKPLIKTQLVCTICKQEFNCKENFRAHLRSHTGEKPYGCRHCLKTFSSLQGRWQHEKIHKR